LVILAYASLTHQRILKRFVYLTQTWPPQTNEANCFRGSSNPSLAGKYREPDAMIWLNEHKNRWASEKRPPDLALELFLPTMNSTIWKQNFENTPQRE